MNKKNIKKVESNKFQQFYSAVEQTADSVFITDKDGLIEYVNPAFEEITGFSKKEALGHTPRIIKSGYQDNKYYKKLWLTILSGKTFRSTVVNRKKDEKLFYADHTITPIKTRSGKVTHFVGIWKDITKQVELEKRREEFMAIATHEMKNPLTTIKGYTQLLEEKLSGKNDKKSKEYISEINYQTEKILNLIRNFFDVSKIEKGKFILNKTSFDIDELVIKIVNSFKHFDDTHKFDFSGKSSKKVFADEEKIGQVLINLISNAIKYSPNASKVTVAIKSKKDFIQIDVKDNGVGIPKSKQKVIFDRFYQVNESEGRGFGLGLYISTEIIKKHKGRLWVESQEGKGSTFSFSIPL